MKRKEIFFLENVTKNYPYTSKSHGGRKPAVKTRNRYEHGNFIQSQLLKIWEEHKGEQKKAVSINSKEGMYLEFIGAAGFDLVTKSLENERVGIKLLNVKVEQVDGKSITKSTVYIPKGQERYFLKKVDDYLNKDSTRSGDHKPCNQSLIDSIEDIQSAIIESFWNGEKDWIPSEKREWCEIWVTKSNDESLQAFLGLMKKMNITVQKESIKFPERIVFLVKANRNNLNELIFASDHIAEFRRAAETKRFFAEMPNAEQAEWVKDAGSRIEKSSDCEDISVCILDTGVNNGHPLLSPILEDQDCRTYIDKWNTSDHDGHGTLMAGIAGYNDITSILEGTLPINITHVLESSKILPPPPESNDPKLYGAITLQSISNKIIKRPKRKSIFCMAVTTDEFNSADGHPSSWSASIDEAVFGKVDNIKKLMLISSGNMNEFDQYPDGNITSSVECPGQSWNALTVGAYTELISADPECQELAQSGELSPYSKTSRLWDKIWPIKPEILLEGGNLQFVEEDNRSYQTDELSEISTYYKPQESLLSSLWATSLATAKAAYMAAKIQAAYPKAWPETVRALLVHSANWTDAMKKQFLKGKAKGDYSALLRTCGYGVPNLKKAIECANSSVSLVVESELKPFKKVNGEWKSNEMHLHEIPWPKEVLLMSAGMKCRLRVTLSYFIEPSPGELGWKNKYRYASCGLRFRVNGGMNRNEFVASISKEMELEGTGDTSSLVNWTLGESRDVGSVHSDFWDTTAAEIATSHLIAVYPVIGWWRELKRQGKGNEKIRYSLVVSIESPDQSIDLYTPIANMIASTNKVKTLIEIPHPRRSK